MAALSKLMQPRGSHSQDKDDADRQGRENHQQPICMSDHGYLPRLVAGEKDFA